MSALKERLRSGILANINDITINTPSRNTAPHILNVSFAYVKSEVLLHSLEIEGIYVSSGSACSSHKKGPSYVLTAIGIDRKMIDGSIRFSLSEFTTEQEIDYTIEKLTENVKNIRRLIKR
jgi:cysteine desulfurase